MDRLEHREPMLDGIAQSARDRSEPILRAGNTNCGGCGMSIGWNFLSRAVADRPGGSLERARLLPARVRIASSTTSS